MVENTNILVITGTVSKIEESHVFNNEKFYKADVEVARLSDNVDIVPVVISEKLLFHNEVKEGATVTLQGQVRTRTYAGETGNSHLSVFGYANDFAEITQEDYDAISEKNCVELEGYICKQPVHRVTTNTGRTITDLLVAVNRKHGKSDYIPCICWGMNAKMAKKLRVGEKIKLTGRFQSRKYRKKYDVENKINLAYEVSITNFNVVDDSNVKDDAKTPATVVAIA